MMVVVVFFSAISISIAIPTATPWSGAVRVVRGRVAAAVAVLLLLLILVVVGLDPCKDWLRSSNVASMAVVFPLAPAEAAGALVPLGRRMPEPPLLCKLRLVCLDFFSGCCAAVRGGGVVVAIDGTVMGRGPWAAQKRSKGGGGMKV